MPAERPSPCSRIRGLTVAFVLVALAWASAASATSYVMTTDDELLARAEVVVLARVVSTESAPTGSRPATDYLIEIQQLIKGFVPASNILVRIPGGQRPDGTAWHLYGAPRFAANEELLLFLHPQDSGTFSLVELGLGAFRSVDVDGQRLVTRDLSAAQETRLRNDPRSATRARAHLPRRLDRFADWLRDRDAGVQREPDYFEAEPEAAQKLVSAFTLTRSSTSPFPNGCGAQGDKPVRWQQFDSNTSIRVLADAKGQEGVPNGGFDQVKQAISTWNAVNGTRIKLLYGGTTSSLASAQVFDDRNLLINDDPFGDIDGTFRGSGTVAVTFSAFDCFDNNTWENGTAHDLTEADIVFQDGTGSFFFANSATPSLDYGEVVLHELGHFIGLGHACGDSSSPPCSSSSKFNDATMRATVHGNGRGFRLGTDDKEAVQFLYPSGGGGGGGGGGGKAPTAPSGLSATAINTTEIQLAWTNTASNATDIEVQERRIDGSFATITTVAGDIEQMVVTNVPPGSFRSYQLRARNNAGSSGFSNEAGTTTFVVPGDCIEDFKTLCLNGDRFRVLAEWEDPSGAMGDGMAVPLTDDTGYFWFFEQTNVEVVIKDLTGCTFNGSFWVFAGGLTDVEVILTVSDMDTGDTRTYYNSLGSPFQPVRDTSAFATCP